ncbi:hypothetical protein AAV94_08945 [Lampropedia cohaerens]|uniref:UDP-N-acetylmuramoyl-L-alanyl-D-glutamate--2,6-diaminopimelate ligase n=1 Tax=Lampropedia cohaerens TaxID=1610491 RepID=A0A0U1PZ45_9BURK|nr:UDP-N-acetylmuramoyl-L-alanyl-D-glutamate--2,6-diaminopimelate ligase [Lampropedia cohaerens]KKW67747.1 hypothetical protein AAV94_08945 [Lampropedia cohaerens]
MTQATAHLHDILQVMAWLRQHAQPAARLCSDSRSVQAGDVFLAWPGRRHDAREDVAAAFAAGASAALVQAQPGQWQPQPAVPAHAVASYANLYRDSGAIASAWLGHPSAALDVVAVTGTNGKTTLAWWLSHALTAAARPCGYVGTLGAGMHGQLQDTGLTSPQALQLQQTLAQLRDAGAVACAVEASSIGLQEGRLGGCQVRVAILTNLSQDHLDYHGTMAAYADAKAALFDWPDLQAAVLNADDALGQRLIARLAPCADAGLQLWDYAVCDAAPQPLARLVAGTLRFDATHTHCEIAEYAVPQPAADAQPVARVPLQAPVTGRFNVHNLLGLLGALRALGMPLQQAVALCRELPAVPGRMQMHALADCPLVVVDYAHTPDALRAALAALRPVAAQRGGRLHVVFGCGGDRDASKRPLMAMAAAQQADVLWITSDNPRSEQPASIVAQMETGLTPAQRAVANTVLDRRQAIAQAIAAAAATDVVLVAGKGHETYQEVKGVKQPFSDNEEVASALALRQAQPRAAEVSA